MNRDFRSPPPSWRRGLSGWRQPSRAWLRPLALLLLLGILVLAIEGPAGLHLSWLTEPGPQRRGTTPNAAGLYGLPRVVDGDTIAIDGRNVRLDGIDAPESGQICRDSSGAPWACGLEAKNALNLHLGLGLWPVRCQGTGKDRYDRVLATCFRGEENLNRWMVVQGWAVAYRQYSSDYVAEEAQARAAGAGLWSGTFAMPWDWRREQAAARRQR